jgi:hypothetical protein
MPRPHRKVLFASLAVFAFGLSFAAQPTEPGPQWNKEAEAGPHWVPGSAVPMSVYETGVATMAPPR